MQQILVALSVFISRFLAFPANFSPVGAFGFSTSRWWLYAVTIVGFDLVRGGFYPGFWLTYGGFAMYFLFGRLAGESLQKRLIFLPVASVAFFFLSNLGVWWYWYDHTAQDLVRCFTLALPFFRNTFLSDLIFGYGAMVVSMIWSRLSRTQNPQVVTA